MRARKRISRSSAALQEWDTSTRLRGWTPCSARAWCGWMRMGAGARPGSSSGSRQTATTSHVASGISRQTEPRTLNLGSRFAPQTGLRYKEHMDDDLARIAFVTRRYQELKGLQSVAFGSDLLCGVLLQTLVAKSLRGADASATYSLATLAVMVSMSRF